MPHIHTWIFKLFNRQLIPAVIAVLLVMLACMGWADPITAASAPNAFSTLTVIQSHFAYAEIRLWPEFDQPSMLVMYTMMLAPASPVPAQIAIRIPTSAGMPNTVAVGPDPDNLFETEFSRQVEGQWSTIRVNTALPLIRIEYYDPTIGKNRYFNYTWPADYPTDVVLIQIQKPFGAKNIQISPTIADGEWASDGVLNYFSADATNLANGKQFTIDLSYQKETDVLSVTGLEVRSTVPVTFQTHGRLRWWSTFPWMLFLPIIIIFLIISGLLYTRVNPIKLIPLSIEKRTNGVVDKSAPPAQDVPVFIQHCQQCGRRANPGDRFCRACGTRLRKVV
jgi:hypothetical protein